MLAASRVLAVEKVALVIPIDPILLRQTSPDTYTLVRGAKQFLASLRGQTYLHVVFLTAGDADVAAKRLGALLLPDHETSFLKVAHGRVLTYEQWAAAKGGRLELLAGLEGLNGLAAGNVILVKAQRDLRHYRALRGVLWVRPGKSLARTRAILQRALLRHEYGHRVEEALEDIQALRIKQEPWFDEDELTFDEGKTYRDEGQYNHLLDTSRMLLAEGEALLAMCHCPRFELTGPLKEAPARLESVRYGAPITCRARVPRRAQVWPVAATGASRHP